ncbi:MAG: hypothetical protein ACE5EH_02210 [Gammaproteobacteria bacterium]
MIRSIRIMLVAFAGFFPAISWASLDSYEFFHVTIETPYVIFLFLVAMILTPFFLMAILYWRFANHKPSDDEEKIDKNDG